MTRCRAATALALTLVCGCHAAAPAVQVEGGDAARGAELIRAYGCGSCHVIPGITGARGLVGPPLAGMARRVYVGGVLPNMPDDMIRWLLDPPAVDPRTAMPAVGLNEAQARHVAAYLYTLD